MNKNSPVGIFDSGLGGLSVAALIQEMLPHENLLYFGDSARNPYGTKTKEQIAAYSMEIVKAFEKQDVKAVVIACNTATSAAASLLRETFDFDIIGMEPALKVGAEYKEHSRIAVWATPLTLQEQKFQNLMHRFEGDHEIVTVACEKLVECVENDRLQDKAYVKSILQEYLEQSHPETIDCIVLGCTHFIFFKEELEKMTEGKIAIVDGNLGTVKRLESLLKQKDLCAQNGQGSLQLDNSLPEKNALAQKLVQELKEQYGKHEKCMADLQ